MKKLNNLYTLLMDMVLMNSTKYSRGGFGRRRFWFLNSSYYSFDRCSCTLDISYQSFLVCNIQSYSPFECFDFLFPHRLHQPIGRPPSTFNLHVSSSLRKPQNIGIDCTVSLRRSYLPTSTHPYFVYLLPQGMLV